MAAAAGGFDGCHDPDRRDRPAAILAEPTPGERSPWAINGTEIDMDALFWNYGCFWTFSERGTERLYPVAGSRLSLPITAS